MTRKNMGLFFDRVLAPTLLRGLLEDQNGLEAVVRMSGLDWVLVRPGRMTDVAFQWKVRARNIRILQIQSSYVWAKTVAPS